MESNDHDTLLKVEMRAEDAHRRIDVMQENWKVSLEQLSTKVDGLLTLKDKMLGGAVVVMFIVTTAISIYASTK